MSSKNSPPRSARKVQQTYAKSVRTGSRDALKAQVVSRTVQIALGLTERLETEELQEVVAAPTDAEAMSRLAQLTRPPKQSDPLRAARERGEAAKRKLESEAGGFLSTREVQELLGGISAAAITKQISAGKLLMVKDQGNRFPRIQFDEKTGEVRRGLPQVLKALRPGQPVGSWGTLAFLLTPNHRLGGRKPIDALSDSEAVLRVARAHQSHGAP